MASEAPFVVGPRTDGSHAPVRASSVAGVAGGLGQGSGAVPSSPAEVISAAGALRAVLARFDPDVVLGPGCAAVAEVLARTERACAGARARAGAKAILCGEHKARGFADGADWLAAETGTTVAGARSELQAAGAIKDLAATSAAVARGEVSLAQAAEVARAEAAVPGSEEALVGLAKSAGLGAVRDQARKVVLGAVPAEELAARQHQARYFRHWRDGDGMVRFAGALPPSAGVGLMAHIDAEANRLRRAAGPHHDSFEAHGADAVVALVEGKAKAAGPRLNVNVVIDLLAYRRGHVLAGEQCHIIGGGPVPVSWVRQVLGDAFVKAVLHDGAQVRKVAHFGRHIKAELRTALELGSTPGFEGLKCSVPGCERRYGLEWDHVVPLNANGPTSYDNLQPRCQVHHWEKTERDRQAGLLAPRSH